MSIWKVLGLSLGLVGLFAASAVSQRGAVLADYGSAPALQLPWPTGQWRNVSGFTYGSAHQVCGIPTTHTGVDWYAIDFGLVDEEVDAAAYGQVGAIGYDPIGGEYIWIKHPNNVQTYYGHLSTAPGDIYVNVNDNVAKGQRIAKSDTSGSGAQGPHLHFRVTSGGSSPWNGTPYKPEPMSGVGPPGYVGWDRYGCNLDTTTTFESTPPNEQVIVAGHPTSPEDLLIRGTDGAVWIAPTDPNGNPQSGWSSLGGTVKGAPCGVWNDAGNRLDVYAIGVDDHPWRRSWVNGGWQTSWTQQSGSSGSSETEGLTCARRHDPPNDSVDLFIRGVDGAGWHAYTDANGNVAAWDSLGGAVKGAPGGAWDAGTWNPQVSWLDVYAIIDDQVSHGVWKPGSWSGFTATVPLSGGVGQAESEMVSAVRNPSSLAVDIFVRDGSGGTHHGVTDLQGRIQSWELVGSGGIVKGAATSKWDQTDTRLDAFAAGTTDYAYRITQLSGTWGNWTLLPGGGLAG